ncbi:MAG TPA: phosphatidylglycerophosphate synthase [Streptomyces sp.]|nr:phosphatidylglycerophosphate synthase [Streptomyces sp.]
MEIPPLAEVRRRTEKKRDAWWTVLLVDPVATPLVRWTAMWPRVTPNQITWAALVMGLGAAACFSRGDWSWLIAGAVLYHVSFILDCMDGKLARLTGRGSEFGAWLDYVFDRLRVLICAVALMGGQYSRTGDVDYVWLALAVVFLDMLRYIDALQIFKVRHGMRKKLKRRAVELHLLEAGGTSSEAAFGAGQYNDEQDRLPESFSVREGGRAPVPLIATQESFLRRFSRYERVRDYLVGHRIRTHLVSGIEFQMGVFIIAPLTGAIMVTTVAAGALLVLFELAIIYKLLLSTRDFERILASYDDLLQEQAQTVAEEPAPAPAVPHLSA